MFRVLSFFKNGGTIQRGTLFKGGHYLRKYGIYTFVSQKKNHNKEIGITSKLQLESAKAQK